MTSMLPSRYCELLAACQSRAASAVLIALDCRVAAFFAMTETVRAKGGWYDHPANPACKRAPRHILHRHMPFDLRRSARVRGSAAFHHHPRRQHGEAVGHS